MSKEKEVAKIGDMVILERTDKNPGFFFSFGGPGNSRPGDFTIAEKIGCSTYAIQLSYSDSTVMQTSAFDKAIKEVAIVAKGSGWDNE